MSKASVIIFLSVMLCSCHVSKHSRRHITPVPLAFFDTITVFGNYLQQCRNCNYISFTERSGNCFGPCMAAKAIFIWNKDGVCHTRNMSKKPKQRKTADVQASRDCAQLFSFFTDHRIDTITSLPADGFIMDPQSFADLTVKTGNVTYHKSFDPVPFFSTKDTTHLLYLFAKQVTSQ